MSLFVTLGIVAGFTAGPAQAVSPHDVTITCSVGGGRIESAVISAEVGDVVTIHQTGCGWFSTDFGYLVPFSGRYWALPAPPSGEDPGWGTDDSSTISFKVIAPWKLPADSRPEQNVKWSMVMFQPTGSVPHGTEDQTYVQLQSGTPSPCKDFLFIGARGSGEALGAIDLPGGPEMDRLYSPIYTGVLLAGKSIAARQVGPSYTAPGVETITANLGSSASKWKSRLASNLATYLDAEKVGVTELNTILEQEASRCPDQKFILAGYSQGAMVINDELLAIGRSQPQPSWISRIKAVVLIANPERLASDSVVNLGTARNGDGACGFSDALAKTLRAKRCWIGGPAKLGGLFANRVLSVCLADDVVCSTQQWASDYAFAAATAPARRSALKLATEAHSLYKFRPETTTAGKRALQLLLR